MDMCNALEKLVEKGRAEGEARGEARGRAEGEAQERVKNIVNMYEEGLSLTQIARIAEIELGEVETIIKKQKGIGK